MNEQEKTAYLATLKKASLSKEAKLRMREELASYADFHGVRMEEGSRSIGEMQSSSVFALITNFSRTRIMKATLILALMVGLGGGTSFAAQQSVPGDTLYPVKVHVNENVRTAFAFDANAQAKLQAGILQERLEEAQALAARGKLEGEVEASVQAHVAAQVDKTIAASEKADAEVAAQVRVAVSDALRSFSTRLAVGETGKESHTGTSVGMALPTAAKNGVAMDRGMDADVMTMSAFGTSEIAGEISVESIVAQAQARLEALQKTIRAAVGMGAEVKAQFEAQLQAASTLVTEAQAHLKTGAEAQAESSVQRAHEIMGEIESALSLMGAVEIDLNTGHIIGIDLSGNTSGGAGVSGSNGGADVDTGATFEGGASLEDDMIDSGQVDPVPAVLPLLGP